MAGPTVCLAPPRVPRRHFPIAFLLLITVELTFGCSGSAPERPKPLPPAAFATLKQRIAELRDLPFKRDVTVAAFAAAQSPGDDFRSESVTQLGLVYKRLGLLPDGADFARDVAEFTRLQRLVFYDAQSASIVVSPKAAPLGTTLAANVPRRVEQVPAVLALALALQEQNFDWQAHLKAIALEDRRLAFQSLSFGDALLLAQSHVRGNQPSKWADDWQAIVKLSASVEHLARSLPELLREQLIFPYREGSQFVHWALVSQGWRGVNALFGDPPLSSAQVLHPERYYITRENPRRILPLGLMRGLRDSPTMDQTLGEFLIRRLLLTQLFPDEAAQVASAWRGDYLTTYDDKEQPIIAWYSSWRDDESAEAFTQALKSALERRHRMRFERSAEKPNHWHTDLPRARAAILQRTGATVAWLDNVSTDRLAELGAELWRDVEITAEPDQFPFDSAGASRQLSRRSR